jgi:Domain of unknown function (DUF1707)
MKSEHSTMTALPPRMRASDSERSATIDVLQDAMTRGLLTHEECDERMAAAFAARFRDELPPLTADLPPVAPPTPARAAPTSWGGLFSALVVLVRAEVAATAAAGFRSRRGLVTALVALLLLGGLTIAVVHGFVDGGPGHLADRGAR